MLGAWQDPVRRDQEQGWLKPSVILSNRLPFESSIAGSVFTRLQWVGSGGLTLVLTIRLSRIGKKKKPFYRVVVIERTRPRDGRVKEAVGTYDPLKKPAEIKLDADRIKYWLSVGAQPSDTVRSFLKLQKIA